MLGEWVDKWQKGHRECGTHEYLCLGKCAFSIKALDFVLGRIGGYIPLPWLARENIPQTISKGLAPRPLVCRTPSETDGIFRGQQSVNRCCDGSTLEGNVWWGSTLGYKGIQCPELLSKLDSVNVVQSTQQLLALQQGMTVVNRGVDLTIVACQLR